MKQTVKIITGGALLAAISSFTPVSNTNPDEMNINNVEALYDAKNPQIVCFGEGTIDCVKYKTEFKVVYTK